MEAEAQAARLVTERLNEITARAERVRRLFLIRGFVMLPCLMFGLSLLTSLLGWDKLLRATVGIPFGIVFWIAQVAIYRVRERETPSFNADEIARFGGVQAIAPLLATFQATPSILQQQAIRYTLTTLLPQMKVNDAPLLTPAGRRLIHSWLNSPSGNQPVMRGTDALRVAALKALEEAGDSTAIPIVERLAQIEPLTPGQEKVKRAATECLPMLRANCGEVETARTLLRASQAGEARPDTLLRPASGAGQTDSAELLRADLTPRPPSLIRSFLAGKGEQEGVRSPPSL